MKSMHKPVWDNLNYLIKQMNKLFEEIDAIGKSTTPHQIESGAFVPPMDIYEAEAEFVITAEIPEVSQKDISITVEDNILILKGERRLKRNIHEERYLRIERSYGTFQKSFTLPANVDKEKVSAKLIDGVLYIHLSKKDSVIQRNVEIEIKD